MSGNALAMGWDEWMRHDATSLAALVRGGQLTAQEVAAQAAAGVARVNGRLNGVLEVFDDVVADPQTDRPDRAGRLYGVPMFLKDLGSRLKGRRQEAGTRLLAGNVAKDTDPLVENFLSAGLVPMGRSTTPEFGMSFDTATSYLGHVHVTRNPWNTERTPGGSSGGSAAMVAAGVTPISMASDGGGSTRIPASFCGLIGLKASRGRMAMPLLHNEFTWRIAVEGMVTRTVRDTATAMDYLVRVPNGGTFYPMQRPEVSYAEAARQSPGRLRIALSTGRWGRTGACDPEVADRIRGFARLLESLRHDVVEIDDAKICDWEAMWSGYITQWVCGRVLYAPIAETAGMDAPAMLDALSPMVRRHFEAAQSYSTLDLYKAMACNNAVTRAFGRVMESWDLLLCPTLAVRVPKANGPYSLLNDEPLEGWLDRISAACRYTMPGNESGLPGISLPAGFDSDGLPVGAMLYANYGREDVLLRIAAQIEAAEPAWFARAPKLNVATPG